MLGELIHRCRTEEMAAAVGLRAADIIESWGEQVYADYFRRNILPLRFFYSCVGVDGVLPSNNSLESTNRNIKEDKLAGAHAAPTGDVVKKLITDLVTLDGKQRTSPTIPFQRKQLCLPAAHVKRAKRLLDCTKACMWSTDDATVLYVDCPYDPSIGASQRKRRAGKAGESPASDGPRELQKVSEKRVRAYELARSGTLRAKGIPRGQVMDAQTIRDKFLSLVKVERNPGSTDIRCDCKEWVHQLSCPHVLLYQHLADDNQLLFRLTSPPVRALVSGSRGLVERSIPRPSSSSTAGPAVAPASGRLDGSATAQPRLRLRVDAPQPSQLMADEATAEPSGATGTPVHAGPSGADGSPVVTADVGGDVGAPQASRCGGRLRKPSQRTEDFFWT
eukprot:GHVU01017637.1.p1 GENE.GHVU01017637.1~~GHVU01017637.1.p1  ORF type:complete len:391 (+),score=43.02 GHVU01017637.1:767-1939(+)